MEAVCNPSLRDGWNLDPACEMVGAAVVLNLDLHMREGITVIRIF
jgi:hypothetical protein